MKQIKKNNNYKFSINKSCFEGFSFKIKSNLEIQNILNDLKKQFHNANHICYAYCYYDEKEKKFNSFFYESTEPKNSSGKQIMNVIEKFDLKDILIVIVRYVKKKLGLSLLQKTYYMVAEKTIDNDLEDYYIMIRKQFIIPLNKLDYFLKKCNDLKIRIISKQFLDLKVEIIVELPEILNYLNEF